MAEKCQIFYGGRFFIARCCNVHVVIIFNLADWFLFVFFIKLLKLLSTIKKFKLYYYPEATFFCITA